MAKINITTSTGIVAVIIDLDDEEYKDYDLSKPAHKQALMDDIIEAIQRADRIEASN